MSDQLIRISLDSGSIDRAIQQLNAYADSLTDKAARLRNLIGERIGWSASEGFHMAVADDIFTGGDRPMGTDVTVTVDDAGDVTVVLAEGDDAVFIEFGAGVYYNGAAGASPHPHGQEHGFLIGEYGKGQGKKNVWALPGSTKDAPILTHGTPAAMPMYHAVRDAVNVIADLARGVFDT